MFRRDRFYEVDETVAATGEGFADSDGVGGDLERVVGLTGAIVSHGGIMKGGIE